MLTKEIAKDKADLEEELKVLTWYREGAIKSLKTLFNLAPPVQYEIVMDRLIARLEATTKK